MAETTPRNRTARTKPAAPRQRDNTPGRAKARPPAREVPAALAAIWQAAPPLGQPAAATGDIIDAVGLPHYRVLTGLNQLADLGRAQRLEREGSGTLWWRRQ